MTQNTFFNLYRHNFVRVAVGIPQVRVADPGFNAAQTISLMRKAAEQQALLVVFPELGLSAYSCEDLAVGKEDFRRLLVAGQSGRCLAAYIYCIAGPGESTTDPAWDGHGVFENAGHLFARGSRFTTPRLKMCRQVSAPAICSAWLTSMEAL